MHGFHRCNDSFDTRVHAWKVCNLHVVGSMMALFKKKTSLPKGELHHLLSRWCNFLMQHETTSPEFPTDLLNSSWLLVWSFHSGAQSSCQTVFFLFITHDLLFDLDFQTCFPPRKNITYFIYTHLNTIHIHTNYICIVYSYVVIMPCFMNCMFSGMDVFHLDATWSNPGMAGKPQFQAMRLSTRDRFDWGPGHRLEVRVNASVQLDVHPAPFFWW